MTDGDQGTSAATVADRPPTAQPSQSVETPEDALRVFEARRARSYAIGLASMCLAAAGIVLYLGGDPLAQQIHVTALVVTGLFGIGYVRFARDPARFRVWHVQALAYFGITANATGYFYWGPYSAYLAVLPISAYAFTSGTGLRTMLGPTLYAIAGHLVVAVGQLEGWLPPTSLLMIGPNISSGQEVAILVVMQLLVISATAGGADAYRIMRQVLDEYRGALVQLAQRDAQLAEANEAARLAHGAKEGRHSGQQLGRFAIGDVIGRGAMGEVYAATDDAGRPCAVKVLASHLLGNPDALARFHREARVVSGLDVPNIVKMIEISPAGARVPYLAMERLDGTDLAALLKEQSVRELAEVLAIVRSVAAGLDVAHDAGVVHRDLKPANLFRTRGGVWKILDFGVSKHADDVTLTGAALIGTPGYMSPEQARGAAIDRRADVYALGVVAYRLLTGRPAVVPGDVAAMVHEVVYKMPPQPSQFVALSAQVEAVLAIALAKSPDDRFQNAGELAAALAEAAASLLPAITMDRAERILRKTPWGHWMRGRAATRAPTTRARES